MPPSTPADWRTLVERWLAQVMLQPLDESEADDLRSSREYRSNSEFALRLGPDGVPVWWPITHPRTRGRLSPERRRAFFLEWLGGVWNCHDPRIRRGAQSYRRRRLAIELVFLQADITEAWEQMPWDEDL